MSTETPGQPETTEHDKHHPLLELFNADGVIEHPAEPQTESPNDVPLADPYAS